MKTIRAKTIISGYSPNEHWFGMNYNMNIYRGCNHGCIYCDSRSDCYRVEDFDTVAAKENALEIIGNELRSKRKKGVVGTGAMSDPYNSFEKTYELTRGAVKLIDRYRFGFAFATKSTLCARDADLMAAVREHSPVLAKITITTADDSLAGMIEPFAPPSSERFEAAAKLSEAGIPVCVLLMPVLPFINDTEENIRQITRLSAQADVKYIYAAMGVTLRENQKLWYFNELEKKFPGVKALYDREFGYNLYEHHSPKAAALYAAFCEECAAAGIKYRMQDIIADYKKEYEEGCQLSLF